MYHWYFSLEKNPFKGSPDNGVVWSGKRRAKVLADLKQGIEADCRFMLLTGGPGTGKTTLVRNLVHTLPKAMRCAHIADPGRERHDLFLSIARDLGFDGPCRKSKKFASWLFSCLQHPDRQGQRAVIVVDQAQCMPGRFLSELVSCARSMPDQCLTILLVGRPGLHGVMEKTLGAGWRDMMDVHAVLNPLTQTETEEFINHLLVLAGAQYEIFNPPAIRQAFIYSKGSLRRLSRACDQAMITAYSKDMNRIDGPVFQEAVGKPAPKEDIEPFSASLPEKEAATRQSRVKRPARWVGSLAAALALAVLSCCFVFDPDLGLDKILGRAVSGLSENTGFKPVSFAVTSGDAKSSPGPDAVTMPAVVRAGVTQSVPPRKTLRSVDAAQTRRPGAPGAVPAPVTPKTVVGKAVGNLESAIEDEFVKVLFSFAEPHDLPADHEPALEPVTERAAKTDPAAWQEPAQEHPCTQTVPDYAGRNLSGTDNVPGHDAAIDWLIQTKGF